MYERFLARALESTSRSVLLLGPRQVGKSTLLASLRPELTVNLASPATFRDYASRPEQLEHELDGAPATTRTVFIDEVQRVPALLDVAQVFIDRRPPRFRFLLSGSRPRRAPHHRVPRTPAAADRRRRGASPRRVPRPAARVTGARRGRPPSRSYGRFDDLYRHLLGVSAQGAPPRPAPPGSRARSAGWREPRSRTCSSTWPPTRTPEWQEAVESIRRGEHGAPGLPRFSAGGRPPGA